MKINDKLLTIIVPAYNVEDYIENGLKSLIREQSIIKYLDIIVINDGSVDKTSLLAHNIADKYPESIKVIDKKNGGHGSGLNVGIKEAKGTYLKVLDGDDWYDSEGLLKLVTYISKDGLKPDVIINPYEKVWESGKRTVVGYDGIIPGNIYGYSEVNKFNYSLCLPSMTIKTEIFHSNDIRKIDEKIAYDDMEYDLYIVPFVEKIIFLTDIIYQYRYGLVDQSMNDAILQKKLPMHDKMVSSLANYYRENYGVFTREQKRYYLQEFVNTIGVNCNVRISMNADKKSLIRFLSQYEDFPLTQMKNKKVRFLLKTNFFGYKMVVWYHHCKKFSLHL